MTKREVRLLGFFMAALGLYIIVATAIITTTKDEPKPVECIYPEDD